MAVALNPKPAIPNGTYKIRSLARSDLFLALGSLVDDQISMKAIMANAKGAQKVCLCLNAVIGIYMLTRRLENSG
jgi:hypothetical protein